MSWYTKAAAVTEKKVDNVRYDANGFARVLQKYDQNRDRQLNASELQSLLNKMLSRYGQSISYAEAQDILTAFGASDGIATRSFAASVVKFRGKSAETYTRLMANILERATAQGCANIACVANDPFASRDQTTSALKPYICVPIQPKETAPQPVEPIAQPIPMNEVCDEPAAPAPQQPAPIENDPFAGLVIGGVTQDGQKVQFLVPHSHKKAGQTDLDEWNEMQARGGGCGEHCDASHGENFSAAVREKIGKSYSPHSHDITSDNLRDAETAYALGANIWAQFENREIAHNGFNLNRDFNPAPLNIHGLNQSMTLGYAKGYLQRGLSGEQFLKDKTHFETTHFDSEASRVVMTAGTEEGAQAAFLKNLHRTETSSALLQGVVGQNLQAARFDVLKTLNASGTLNAGGIFRASRIVPQQTDDSSAAPLSQEFHIEAAPMVYKVMPHATLGAGLVLRNGEAPALRTDASMVDWWSTRNAFRLVSDVNAKRANIAASMSSETSNFSLPTYQFSYALQANTGAHPIHSFEGEYNRPLALNHGVYGELEAERAGSNTSASIEIGTLHGFGKMKQFAAGPVLALEAASGQKPAYRMGGTIALFAPKKDISILANAGMQFQNGSAPKPTGELTVQLTGNRVFRR